MASAYLGPEIHRPLSVISEGYQARLNIPTLEGEEKFRFGPEYEKKLFSLLNEHLELGITDRLVYVGDTRGGLSDAIEEQFCLLQPVQTVIPGHFHYAETDSGCKVLPIRIAHVGAEEFFRNLAENPTLHNQKYDKILVNDCIHYLAELHTTFRQMVASLAEGGKILVIHRPEELNTLPYFTDAKQRLTENDISYMDIIQALQKICNLDVEWRMECLTVSMTKRKWLAMVRGKFPSRMEILSEKEILNGIRELSEGVLKYEGDRIEFVDRLLFISATVSHQPRVQRSMKSTMLPQDTRLNYIMKIDPEKLHELRKAF